MSTSISFHFEPLNMLPFFGLKSTPDMLQCMRETFSSKCLFNQRNFLKGALVQQLRLGIPKQAWPGPTAVSDTGRRGHLLNLPMNIILNISLHLHTLDLYHLSFTCNLFRRFLLDTNPETWEHCFDQYPKVPRPIGVSLVQWLAFIFGPGICQHCGNVGALICFGISRKYCEDCARMFLVSEDEALSLCEKHTYSHFSKELEPKRILQLCRRSYVIAVGCDDTMSLQAGYIDVDKKSRERVFGYLREEVESFIHLTCPKCQEDADAAPAWEREQEANICKRNARQNKNASRAYIWALRTMQQHQERQVCWYRTRFLKEAKKLGYHDLDIQGTKYAIDSRLPFSSSQKAYKYNFRTLILILDRVREQRLQEEIGSPCSRYFNTLSASECLRFPFALFSTDRETSSLRRPLYPSKLHHWRRTMRNELLQQMIDAPMSIFHSFPRTLVLEESGDSPLELAAAVFSCPQCLKSHYIGAALVGWEVLSAHMYFNPGCLAPDVHISMEWSRGGHTTALLLLDSLGLNPQTTTAIDMDRIDARWFCGNCQYTRADGISFRRALRWRECLTHSVYRVDTVAHNTPNWLLLGEETTRFVKLREMPYPSPDKEIWGCLLCREHIYCTTTYSSATTTYAEAASHVKDVHKVLNPQNGRDITLMMNRFSERLTGVKTYEARKPIRYQTNPPMKYHCLHCPPIPYGKFWTGDEIFKHLKERHHIPELVEGRDWVTFDIHLGLT